MGSETGNWMDRVFFPEAGDERLLIYSAGCRYEWSLDRSKAEKILTQSQSMDRQRLTRVRPRRDSGYSQDCMQRAPCRLTMRDPDKVMGLEARQAEGRTWAAAEQTRRVTCARVQKSTDIKNGTNHG
jgi:hypothetical protein